jgi:DNA-binding MarR family transcriptional regulator
MEARGGDTFPSVILIAVAFVCHAIRKRLSQKATMSISTTQYCGLLDLYSTGVAKSITELANKAGLTSSAMTTAIQDLYQKQLIDRLSDEADGRVIRVRINDHGRDLIDALDPLVRETIGDLWCDLDYEHRKLLLEDSVRSTFMRGHMRTNKRDIRADSAYVFGTLMFESQLKSISSLHRINFKESMVLCFLSEQNGPIKVSQISTAILSRPSSLTNIYKTLEKLGLIRLSVNPQDLRSVLAAITEMGKEKTSELKKDYRALIDEDGTIVEAHKPLFLESIAESIVNIQRERRRYD